MREWNSGIDSGSPPHVLKVVDFSYGYPGADRPTLDRVHLDVKAGECVCVNGPTGCGKSTLLLAIKGLLPEGNRSGRIVYSRGGPDTCAIVTQDPEVQILRTQVGPEVAFGLENLGISPDEMPARVKKALLDAGLDRPFHFPSEHLSMGQKYRLLIAANLVMNAKAVLLDEPVAQLDFLGLRGLISIVKRLKSMGLGVVICEHRAWELREIADRYLRMDGKGRLENAKVSDFQPQPTVFPGKKRVNSETVAVRAEDLEVGWGGDRPVWSKANFSVAQGERVVFAGVNGTGKSTLIRCLAGFVEPSGGTLEVLGSAPSPNVLRGKVGILFQNPTRQLFEDTVFEEVAFSLKRFGRKEDDIEAKVERILSLCGIAHLRDRSPHKLSFGQKHLTALASVLAFSPRLLLLDDPFAGLDGDYNRRLSDLLTAACREENAAVVRTSHSPERDFPWADRAILIEDGAMKPLRGKTEAKRVEYRS